MLTKQNKQNTGKSFAGRCLARRRRHLGLALVSLPILEQAQIQRIDRNHDYLFYCHADGVGGISQSSARTRNIGRSRSHLLLCIGLCAGWANLAYVLGVIHGEVMRVLLLFYLAPLWTILFARLLLNEQLSLHGYLVIAPFISRCGDHAVAA